MIAARPTAKPANQAPPAAIGAATEASNGKPMQNTTTAAHNGR